METTIGKEERKRGVGEVCLSLETNGNALFRQG